MKSDPIRLARTLDVRLGAAHVGVKRLAAKHAGLNRHIAPAHRLHPHRQSYRDNRWNLDGQNTKGASWTFVDSSFSSSLPLCSDADRA